MNIEVLKAYPLPWSWKDGMEVEIWDAKDQLVAVVKPQNMATFDLASVIEYAVNDWQKLKAQRDALLAALKTAVTVMQDAEIDTAMAGEFEQFTDAIALCGKEAA